MTTKLSHGNFWLHRMLTDQGACTHEHEPDSFEDDGDGESGPHLTGGPAFDRYTSESHEFIIDASGEIVHSHPIDWDLWRFCEGMAEACNGDEEEWSEDRQYVKPRRAGEDWQVKHYDEDGVWWACSDYGWVDRRSEAHYFTEIHAQQIAKRWNDDPPRDYLTGRAKVIDCRPEIEAVRKSVDEAYDAHWSIDKTRV